MDAIKARMLGSLFFGLAIPAIVFVLYVVPYESVVRSLIFMLLLPLIVTPSVRLGGLVGMKFYRIWKQLLPS